MKHKYLLEEFLSEELEEYSYFKIDNIELSDFHEETEYYSVTISGGNNIKTVYFKLDGHKIEIELGEDSWYEVCTYEYNIKYFWMALLKWE